MRTSGITITRGQAAVELSIPRRKLDHLLVYGYFPETAWYAFTKNGVRATRQHLRRSYVEQLGAMLALERRCRHSDVFHFRLPAKLYKLQYEYHEAASLLHSEPLELRRQELTLEWKDLLEFGRIVRFDDLIQTLSSYRDSETIQRWRRKRLLPAYDLGGIYFVTKATFDHVVWLYEACRTPIEVAEQSGIKHDRLLSMIRKGNVVAYQWPGKYSYRVPTSEIDKIKVATVSTLPYISYQQAACKLGVSESELYSHVRTLRHGGKEVGPLCREDVDQWEKEFNTLNPAFDWLQQLSRGQRYKTVNGSRAARMLGMSRDGLSQLSKKGLVPFYCRSFSRAARQNEYVHLYLVGLIRFSQQCQLSIGWAARKYVELCQEERQIV